jgi:hypothetical protein
MQGFNRTSEECFVDLARLFWSWIGPARLADFRTFSGLGAKAAKEAAAPLALMPLPQTAGDDDRLLLPQHLDELAAFAIPREPSYALVSCLDASLLLRQDVKSLLAPEDWDRPVAAEKGTVPAASLTGLPCHAILDRGRLVGLWDYDPQEGEIVWYVFGAPASDELRQRVGATEAVIRDQLGDLRTFSLDSPKSRQPRLAALRAAGRLP